MRVEDLIVEVRDINFERVGLLTPQDLVNANFVLRYNNVGTWQIELPANAKLVDALRTPGSGIVVTGPAGVIMSGPTRNAVLEQDSENAIGLWTITGTDDSLILTERLAYPEPSNDDVSTQSVARDTRLGPAETVIKGFVADNIAADCGTSRAIPNLIIQPDESRGPTISAGARFQGMQDLLYGLAEASNLGYRIVQDAANLVFEVYEPTDRSATVRMDVDNRQLVSAEYAYSAPTVTRAIVGGQGEAVERQFIEGTTSDSIASESVWGRRIERFVDQRQSSEIAELERAAQELLVENGQTIVSLSVTPSDINTMRYNFDWNLGDRVTVVVNELEATAVVTEVGIGIASDGIRIIATVGNPNLLNFESKLLQRQDQQDSRISALERGTTGFGISTEYQPNGGTIGGTQPTFSGDPLIFGQYTRFGNMVHFTIQVDFDNITGFGTGQYFLTVPYNARDEYKFADGCLHQISTGRDYQIRAAMLKGTNVLKLSVTTVFGNRIIDGDFTSTDPVTLTQDDFFHIAGTYEIENGS
jgi:hypothetical protein